MELLGTNLVSNTVTKKNSEITLLNAQLVFFVFVCAHNVEFAAILFDS